MANINKWVDPDTIPNSGDYGIDFSQIVQARNNMPMLGGMSNAMNMAFNPSSNNYVAGNQDLSSAKNASDKNSFAGFTKPTDNGATTAWFSGADNSPEAEFARNVNAKMYGAQPKDFATRPYALQGSLKDGMFTTTNSKGEQVQIDEKALRAATGKDINKLIGHDVEKLMTFPEWSTKNVTATTNPGASAAIGNTGVGKVGNVGVTEGNNPTNWGQNPILAANGLPASIMNPMLSKMPQPAASPLVASGANFADLSKKDANPDAKAPVTDPVALAFSLMYGNGQQNPAINKPGNNTFLGKGEKSSTAANMQQQFEAMRNPMGIEQLWAPKPMFR